MNILIPHSWLLEHLDTDATPQEIQKFLSLCGPSVERIYEREGEPVYDIEVTTNRVDSMSVRGIAREAAVILQQFGKKAKLKKLKEKEIPVREPETPKLILPKVMDEKKLCKRTLCVILHNVERTPTPEWMAKRLRQIEVNVHDSVIDITNYITHELGHPCHAFDYDRVMELGGMVIVTEAKKGKKFVTLDGEEYTTVGGEIVFENQEGEIIDLPAIKGTKNTSINQSTKNILFWIESLDAKKVRDASMSHAIRTVAAQLNEKNVDPELALPVLKRGVELYRELTSAEVASAVLDKYPGQRKPETVVVPLKKIYDYLGVELSLNLMGKILENLGCKVELKGSEIVGRGKKHKFIKGFIEPSLFVTPPTFRPDIQIPADVIEEIARIYGYHNLPSVLMPTAIPLLKPTHTNFWIENRIKRFLADIGWQEVYTYSMVSAEIAIQSGCILEEHLKIQNPLTDDRVYLRRSLIPSLEEVITHNPQRKELSVFEIANTYAPRKGELPNEVLHLSLVSTHEFRHVKGDIEALLDRLFIRNIQIDSDGNMTALQQKGSGIVIGQIKVLANGHTSIDIIVSELMKVVQTHPEYQAAPKTNEIIEDLTFTLPEKVSIGPILEQIKTLSELISFVALKEVYKQNYTVTFVYHNPSANLSAEVVSPLRREIVEKIARDWKGQLVGKIE